MILYKTKNYIKRHNLNYLGFHKFIGMYLIIRIHLYNNVNRPFDYGKRMCELLFISSGFLVGYNYYEKSLEFTYQSSFKYAYKHLRNFYPFYLFNFIYGIYFYKNESKFGLTYIELILINIFMIANWSSHRRIARFYYGISWFLDNLLYCYFLSPLLLYTINNKLTNSLKFLFFAISARILVEEFLNRGAYNVYDTNFHCGPIIRILEFYIGMLISPLFIYFKTYLDKLQNYISFKILFTIVQIVFPICLCYIFSIFNKILLRCYFVLIICIYIFIISYDYGYLSVFVSNGIIKPIMSPQMEMYLIQMNVNITFIYFFGDKFNKSAIREFIFSIKIMIIFIVSFFYRKFIRDKFANLMDKVIFSLI